MPEAVIIVVAMVGLMAWAFAAASGKKQARITALGELAKYLQGTHDGSHAAGSGRGLPITYRYETRGSGSSSESWTEIDATIPAAYPLAIHVRRHAWRDRAHIEAQAMVDVEVGDPEFDRAFLIEAARADVVKILLDADARRLLSAHHNVELDTISIVDRRILRFAVRGWIEDVAIATAAIDGVARLGAHIRDAFAAADAATPAVDGGSPYRPMLDDAPSRDAAVARSEEGAKVEAVRSARFANGGLGIGVILLFGV